MVPGTFALAQIVYEESPSILDVLTGFLFGTIIGWWILIVLAVALSTPLLRLLNVWRQKQRFIREEHASLANPQNAVARFQLARIYHRGRRYRKAQSYMDEAVRIAEESPLYDEIPHKFHHLQGDILYGRGRCAEAAEAYDRACAAKSDTGYADVYLGRGRCALRMGKEEEALDWFRKSLQERTYLETFFRTAQAAARLGRAEEVRRARGEFSTAAAQLPRFARQGRLKWRLLFFLFPITRHLV